MRYRGFSLVELMVIVAIVGILLGVAVPSFQNSIASSRTRSVAESVYSGLLSARSEAIKRNAPMRFQLVTTVPAAGTCAAALKYAASTVSHSWVVTQYTASGSRGVAADRCVAKAYTPEDQEEPCRVAIPASAVVATGWYDGTLYTTASPPAATACLEDSTIPSGQRVSCRPMDNPANCAEDPFIAFSSGSAVSNPNVVLATTGSMSGEFVVTFGPVGQLLANQEGAVPSGSVPYTVSVSTSGGATGRSWRIQVKSNGGIKMCDPGVTDTSNAMFCA